jgi:hypothetical protein
VGTGNNFATIQGRTDGPSGEANGVSYGASYGTKPINYAKIRYAAQGSAGQIGLLAFHTKLLEDDTSQPLERMRITSAGKVGIGTATVNNHKMVIDYGGTAAQTHGSNLSLQTGSGTAARKAVLSYYGTFQSAGADVGQRRTADITSGFRVNNWGNEFLDFGVGGATDAGNVTTTRMTITGAGNVTMPYQPAALASYSGGDISATNVVPLNSSGISRGGLTIGSTSRFTVPVAGFYMIGYHHLATSNSTQIQIRKNGSAFGGGFNTQAHASSQHNNFSAQIIGNLAASDYIEFFVVGSGALHGNAAYNAMYIHFLG